MANSNVGVRDLAVLGFNKGLRSKFPLEGWVHALLFDKYGNLKDERHQKNAVTVLGDALVADAMSDRGVALPTHMAVGTATGGKSTASTTLETELARVALDSTTQGTGASDNDVVWVATFPAGTGTGALVEAGVFNDASAGTMMTYTDFSVINKGASDSLVITWTLTCGAS